MIKKQTRPCGDDVRIMWPFKKKEDTHYDHVLKLDGVHGYVNSVENEGLEITICGWDSTHLKYKNGDLILLEQENAMQTRYRIKKLRSCGNPQDMYFMDMLLKKGLRKKKLCILAYV